MIQGLQRIYQQDGIRGFWRANGTNVLKIIPEAGIRFLSYESYKRLLFPQGNDELTIWQKFVAGGSHFLSFASI